MIASKSPRGGEAPLASLTLARGGLYTWRAGAGVRWFAYRLYIGSAGGLPRRGVALRGTPCRGAPRRGVVERGGHQGHEHVLSPRDSHITEGPPRHATTSRCRVLKQKVARLFSSSVHVKSISEDWRPANNEAVSVFWSLQGPLHVVFTPRGVAWRGSKGGSGRRLGQSPTGARCACHCGWTPSCRGVFHQQAKLTED